jgi:hypothetical protein
MILLEVFEDVQIAVMFVFFIAIAWMLAEFKGMKEEIRERLDIKNEPLRLRLQAYERLTVYADRISIKNLVARIPYVGYNVVDLQLAFLENIRTEYEYNVSQQVYVSHDMWKAISNLKDQNIYIINQIAATIESHASGIELSKRLLEYISTTNADLSLVVLNALQFEAKKIF